MEVRHLRIMDWVTINPLSVMKRGVVGVVGMEPNRTFKLKTGHIMGSHTWGSLITGLLSGLGHSWPT